MISRGTRRKVSHFIVGEEGRVGSKSAFVGAAVWLAQRLSPQCFWAPLRTHRVGRMFVPGENGRKLDMIIQRMAHRATRTFSSVPVVLILCMLLCIVSHSLADPGEWTTKADMPTPRYGLSASAVDGKIYAIGGFLDEATIVSTVEEYDPSTDTWTKKADMLAPRAFHSTSVVNGKIYAIGGTTVEMYDPALDVWIQKSEMPVPRYFAATVAMGDKIYVIGGQNAAVPKVFRIVEEYDPMLDTWTEKSKIQTERSTSVAMVDGEIYAIGGGRMNEILRSVEIYDPAKNKWMWGKNMSAARYSLGASVVNDRIYVVGGTDIARKAVSIVEEYDPVKEIWTRKSDMPTAREYLAVCAVNGKIYAIGGTPGLPLAPLSTVEEYTPDGWPFAVSAQGKLITLWGNIKRLQ